MSEVAAQIQIAAPPEAVWAVAMDPERLGDWVTIHRSLEHHSGGELQPGYEMDQTLALRGVNFHVRWRLVRVDAPHHAEWHGRGPARSHAEIEYRLAPSDTGTRFDYRNEFKVPLGSLGALASRALVGGLSQREAAATLQRLKAVAEREAKRGVASA